jgi:hypothetical protein
MVRNLIGAGEFELEELGERDRTPGVQAPLGMVARAEYAALAGLRGVFRVRTGSDVAHRSYPKQMDYVPLVLPPSVQIPAKILSL